VLITVVETKPIVFINYLKLSDSHVR